MPWRWLVVVMVLASVTVGGCARGVHPPGERDATRTVPATRPIDPSALLTLSQVAADLAPALPSAQPTTRPAEAPLEAIELYARARGAMHDRQSYTAVDLLERAARLDPDSSEVRYALGRAYLLRGNPEQAIPELRRATELNPSDAEAWVELARVYLRTDPSRALAPLIYATRTDDYANDTIDAAVVDFLLARVLAQRGYDRAATEVYERLLNRLDRRPTVFRGNPDVAALSANPQPVQIELGKLYERLGQPDRALAMFQHVADSAPDAFEPQARVVRALLAYGRDAPAARRALDLVRRFSAAPPAVDLLLEVYRQTGDESKAIAELQRLHRANPDDDALLGGLADALSRLGRAPDAQKLLLEAIRRDPDDLSLLRRLVKVQLDQGQSSVAVRALLEASAHRPDAAATDLLPLWRPLLAEWRDAVVRAHDLARVQVPARLEPARQYWVARVAMASNREAFASTTLARAMENPPATSGFPPLAHLRLRQIWLARDVEGPEKQRRAQALIDAFRAAGDARMVATLEAIDAFFRLPSPQDLEAFDRARAVVGDLPPEILLLQAEALRRSNEITRFEQTMWALLSDHPSAEEAYIKLFEHYIQQRSPGSALKVLSTWMNADPRSVTGRTFYAQVMSEARQAALAEAALGDLLRENADDSDVLNVYVRHCRQQNQLDRCIEKLQEIHRRDPGNGAAIEVLFRVLYEQGDTPAIVRLLDGAADAAGSRPNLLYYIAQIYNAIEDRPRAQEMLRRTLAVDPKHVPASNDLAYFWSEDGIHLDRAERMARFAVNAEPDNAAYLDTLGWVLYKQGRFDEARKLLEEAVRFSSPPDPVLLDHLGDAAYRTGDLADAVSHWERAATLLRNPAQERPDYQELRDRLNSKIRQRLGGEPVEVAPIGTVSNE